MVWSTMSNQPFQPTKSMADSNNSPLVTVVIPMFNAFPFIGEMLECMEKQTYSNWELIVVDDGSTDESAATVQSYAEKDSRITLIKRPEDRKKGGNTCRNIGLENAKGEYIIWFDADDLIAPYCLEQRVNYIQKHPEIDIAIAPLISFKTKPFDKPIFGSGHYQSKNLVKDFLSNTPKFVVVSNIYRVNQLHKKNIIWDEEVKSHQDPDMNLECIYKNLSIASIPNAKADYFWRIDGNPHSVSKKIYSEAHLNTNIYYFNKQVERFGNNKQEKKHLKLLVNYIFKIILFQPNEDFVLKFLDQPYFKKNRWLTFKLKTINRFQHTFNFKSHIPTNLFTIMLCPFFELNFRKETIAGRNFQKRFAEELFVKSH